MNEPEILNNARIKLASLLEGNPATEKLAGDTSMPNNFSQKKLAGAFADTMKRTNLINTFKDTGSVLKDALVKQPLGVLGPMLGAIASVPISIGLTGPLNRKNETVDEHRSRLKRNLLLGAGAGATLGFGTGVVPAFLKRFNRYSDLSKHKEQFINAILNKTNAFKNPMTTEQANRMSDWVADKGKQTVDKMTEHLMNTEGADAVLRYMRNLGNAAVELRTDKMFWDM